MNSLGQLFKVTSFGESHGAYVGCIIEGCPAGLMIDANAIQLMVNKRRTNQNFHSSARNEEDRVQIISGVFEGQTIGSPIVILIQNQDAKSEDYKILKNIYRPGHADYSYQIKYGIRDYRGGGRSSIRITAPMVAAGEVANQLLQHSIHLQVKSYVSAIGEVALPLKYEVDLSQIDASPLRCPSFEISALMHEEISKAKSDGDTLGGAISCKIVGLPSGFGEPVYGKLQAMLASAMMNINTAKAFEYGLGKASASIRGSKNNDNFKMYNGEIVPASNKHGGILGGISTGEDICFTVYFKPISSIQQVQTTIDEKGNEVELNVGGRHDVCAIPRAVPIVEAYTNIVLADLYLHSRLNTL